MTIWSPAIGERPGPRYQAIVDALADAIAAGTLSPGDRLPTQRELARRLHVTVGTITRAYTEADRRGLVRGEVGRGTFVADPATAGGAGAFDLVQDGVLADLGMNDPPSPPEGLAEPLRRTLRELAAGDSPARWLTYQPPAGHLRHRTVGVQWLARCGVAAEASQVVVCSGAQHGVPVALRALARPGDVVLCEELTYPGARASAAWLDLQLAGVAMDEEGLLPEALDRACRATGSKVLYTVPTLQNPTGATMSVGRRSEIVAVARAHDLAIVEDDVHALLSAEGLPPLAALAPERTCYVASTAKTLAPGLRVAFVVAPPGHAERLADGVFATVWSAPPLLAEVACRWIEDGTADAMLAARRREAAARLDLARAALSGRFAARSPWVYHLWLPDLGEWDAESLTAAARRRGLVINPARHFAVGRRAPDAVRICLGPVPDRARLASALQRLAALLDENPVPVSSVV